MLTTLGLLASGGIVLYLGAETAVRGASAFARRAGIPVFVLGALLFGLDVESMGTAVTAASRGATQVAAGSIFGSVLFLFSAGFGAALLVSRRPIPSPGNAMVIAPCLPLGAATIALTDRFVSGSEGLILIGFYAIYVALLFRLRRADEEAPVEARAGEDSIDDLPDDGAETSEVHASEASPPPSPRLAPAGAALAGLALLAAGAWLLVEGGTRLIETTTLFPGFVGAAVVGVLTSLDEVLLEIVPVRRGTPELATGNLFGTIAAFSSGLLGLAAVVRPLDLDGAANAAFLGAVFLYAVVAVTFVLRGRAGRLLGGFVLAAYAAWLVATGSV
ncbi:MAG TPA: hypothetical protein VM638_00040 [Actinomycetota bacterium]|nr:hypothetical protein [Actinomycetota bacterium]